LQFPANFKDVPGNGGEDFGGQDGRGEEFFLPSKTVIQKGVF